MDDFNSSTNQIPFVVRTENAGPTENSVEWRAQLMREDREKLVLQPARCFRLGACRLLASQDVIASCFDAFALGNIPCDFGRSDDSTRPGSDRRNGNGYVDNCAVLANT